MRDFADCGLFFDSQYNPFSNNEEYFGESMVSCSRSSSSRFGGEKILFVMQRWLLAWKLLTWGGIYRCELNPEELWL
ncbi:hypothetical protein J1N35_033765 [Gossypium stocksii]|uniref:Uncharacterized protein n=1 Tax=Gossypium stocksii TaxID=47602 RepID=A0A9D3URA1_9ROSI|nr:hypothetical protein J1N35_033765 [Gossypium stocksii]